MSGPDLSALSGEDRLIAQYFRPLATHPGALGLRDDAAFYTPPAGHDLVLTKDAIVAGVHFFEEDPPDTIARKALRVNLSDLAAKGADPVGFLLALALRRDVDEAWLASFSQALAVDAEFYGCALFGGDTVQSPGPLMISVTAFGTVPHGAMVHRGGASAGDRVVVSGSIGDAALGLLARSGGSSAGIQGLPGAERRHLVDRYLMPQPRTVLAEAVRLHASAAMDVSDGLAGDLAKLCRESGVSAEVEAARVPLSPAARAALAIDASLLGRVLTGGDDYEILCAVPSAKLQSFVAAASRAGVAMTEIGGMVAGDGAPRFAGADGQPMELGRGSFSHF